MRAQWLAVVSATLLMAACTQSPEDTARRFVARGDDFARNGRNDAALIEYRNAVRAWPSWNEAQEKLGDTYERLGRSEEAYQAYTAAFGIADGESPKVEESLRDLVARRPALVPARIELADILLTRRDTAAAEEQLKAVTAAQPNHELANRSLAAIYIDSGRMADAERSLRIAAAQEPGQYRSRLALADFLMSARRYDEARAVLEEARKDPQLETAIKLRLAGIDYEQGRVDAAQHAVADMLKTQPTAEAWTLQAQFLYRERKFNEALTAAREALSLDRELVAAQELVETMRRQQLFR